MLPGLKENSMQYPEQFSGCACCHINRRRFLAGCATCAGAMVIPMAGKVANAGPKKKRVRVLYSLHAEVQPGPDWPNVGYDFKPVMQRMTAALAERSPEIEFIPTMATGPEQAQEILKQDQAANIDGYVVLQMNCWNRVVQTMVGSGKPVLYADFLYAGSGGFLVYTAGFLRQGAPNFGFIGSSRFADVAEAANCFLSVGRPEDFGAAVAKVRAARTQAPGSQECKPDELKLLSPSEWKEKMKQSKILTVGGEGWRGPKSVIEELGVQVQEISYAEVNDAWKEADPEKSKAVADSWEQSAAKIAGVSRETLETSAAMYLGQKAVLKKHGADAITINCLGGFYGGHIHAYPCLGFHELCNEGLVGACENDLLSASTMVALKNLTGGRTGFISDPVIDSGKRQIIYAHCVASNRAFGPTGVDNPIEILTHSEDRQGASVRSILPTGYMTTTIEMGSFAKELLFHRGKAVDNIMEDRACRTKLAVEPDGDIEKLYTQWDRFGWHRVTVYGDLKDPLFEIANMLKWKITEEA
jgi:L-fucose isomerase-like protein